MRKHSAVLLTLLMFLFIFIFSQTNSYAASANVSRSYSASKNIPIGSLVSLAPGSTNSVVASNLSNSDKLIGVVVQSNQSLLAVNPANDKLQVATDGSVNALVSTVNGDIKVGQDVAVSPFNGVGMKAGSGDRVIGIAETSFNSKTSGATIQNVHDSNGKTHKITVGFVRLTIGIGTLNSSNFSVQSIQQYVDALIGRPISLFRIVISLIIAIVSMLSIIILIYASIYGSIVSIGRNPLAKIAVFRTLTSVIGMVTLIAGVSSVTIYLLLK